jgi:alpha-L-rhamnosidase
LSSPGSSYFLDHLLAAKTASILKFLEDKKKYSSQAKKIKNAFIKHYFKDDGTLAVAETQTALVLALYFELFPRGTAERLLEVLIARITAKDTHLDTGFVGTPLLCLTLSKYGANETAYSLLPQNSYPGWLYEVSMGATTIWERWNSILPNGKISGTGMNSLNHYSYGSIATWMYRCMGGLSPLEEAPGYKKVRIAPGSDPRIRFVWMTRNTAAGRYEIAWERREDGAVGYTIHIPFDRDTVIALPGREEFIAGAGDYRWEGK